MANMMNNLIVEVGSLEGKELKDTCQNLIMELNIVSDITEMAKVRLETIGGLREEMNCKPQKIDYNGLPTAI